MAYTDRSTTTRTVIPAPADVLRRFRKWLHRRAKRAEIAALLEKEDWILRDMGITRYDVREALAQPGDPALYLRALVARRRFFTRLKDRL